MTTAGDIALFYQALLNDGKAYDGTLWQSEMLREARRIRSGNLIDPARGITANRALNRDRGRRRQGESARFRTHELGRSVWPSGLRRANGWADPATGSPSAI